MCTAGREGGVIHNYFKTHASPVSQGSAPQVAPIDIPPKQVSEIAIPDEFPDVPIGDIKKPLPSQ